MEIKPIPTAGTLTLTARPTEIRNWKVGQILSVVALSASKGGQVTLQAGTTTLTAQALFPVKAGQQLSLQVVSLGKLPVLQLAAPVQTPDPIQSALRAALPRQGGLPSLLANLAQMKGDKNSIALPKPVMQAAQALFNILVDSRKATTPKGLRQAVRDSGVLLEAKLAQEVRGEQRANPRTDLKAGLLQLRVALREMLGQAAPQPAREPLVKEQAEAQSARSPAGASTNAAPTENRRGQDPVAQRPAVIDDAPPPPLKNAPPQPQARVSASLAALADQNQIAAKLLGEVEASVSRVQLSQLASHRSDSDQKQVWLVEIPMRRDQGADVFQLRIEREDEASEHEEEYDRRWNVQLAFDLEGLGPIHARVGVHGDRVSTVLWVEREDTANIVRRHMSELEDRLSHAGLKPQNLACHTGAPPHAAALGARNRLVDEQV